MAIVGLIPFVCAAIKKKRRSTRAARGREREHALFSGGGYQSQSCRFAVRRSPAEELRVSHVDGGGAARHPPPKDLSGVLFSADRYERLATGGAARGREYARFNGGGYQSQSCRFAVRPSPAHELGVSYHDGSAHRRPPVDLSGQLLLPASRNDCLATSAARGREHSRFNSGTHQSQSCRFAVRPSPADELGFSHDEGAARPPPEDLSGKLLLTASRNERGLSKSLRFSSMRVFAWVSGA